MESCYLDSGSVYSYSLLNGLSRWRVSQPFLSIFENSVADYPSCVVVEDPKLVMIVGCVGFGLNIISVLFLHGKHF
jgi:hypothetical protein